MKLWLLWSLVWRSVLLLTPLGIGIGMIVSFVTTFLVYPPLIISGIPLFLGTYSGTIVGFIVGVAYGLVIWGVTCYFFMPVHNTERYRLVVRGIAAGLSVVTPWISQPLLAQVSFGRWSPLSLILYSVLFGLVSWWTSRYLADWYILQTSATAADSQPTSA